MSAQNSKAAETEIDRLVDQLDREHSGDPWHGSPLMSILDGINAQRAATRAVPNGHTIWELVLHVTAWKNETRKRLSGAPAGEPAEGDWPEAGDATPQRWTEALTRLKGAHEQLVAAVHQLNEGTLYEATNDPRNRPLGTGVSYYVLLHGIVQHDVYHAGQMALLKKALGL
jgi:uncharacterized damage-inducible protein DinB